MNKSWGVLILLIAVFTLGFVLGRHPRREISAPLPSPATTANARARLAQPGPEKQLAAPPAATAPAGAPALQWTQRLVEARPTLQQTNVLARFVFKNTSARPVAITAVKSSCGSCTSVATDKLRCQKGEQGAVTANFVIGQRIGRYESTILVQTDDPAEPTAVLTLRVWIPETLKIQPAFAFWQIGEEPKPKTLKVTVLTPAPIHVLKVTSDATILTPQLKTLRKGREYEICVTPADTRQPVWSILKIETDFAPAARRTFLAYAGIKS